MIRNLLCLALLITLIGCSESTPKIELPKTAPVTGVVNLDGKPIGAGASVTFYPTGDTSGIECVGTTDASGKYTLQQIRGEAGAPPGAYKVTVSRFLKPDGSAVGPDEQPINVGAVESIPPTFSDPSQTTLLVTVPEGGGEIPLEVKSK